MTLSKSKTIGELRSGALLTGKLRTVGVPEKLSTLGRLTTSNSANYSKTMADLPRSLMPLQLADQKPMPAKPCVKKTIAKTKHTDDRYEALVRSVSKLLLLLAKRASVESSSCVKAHTFQIP